MNDSALPVLLLMKALHDQQEREELYAKQQETEAELNRLRIEQEKALEEKRQKEALEEKRRQRENEKIKAKNQRLNSLRATRGDQWNVDDLFWVVEEGEYYVANRRPDTDDIGILTLGTSKDIIKAIDEGANPNAVSKYGKIFSFKLMEFEDEKLIDKVMEKCPDLGVVDKDENTLLMAAVSAGNMVALKKLIEKYPDNINAVNKSGNSALDIAAYCGWYEGVNYLIQHGAKVNNQKREYSYTTFECAIEAIGFTFGSRGYKKSSLDDKIYKIPELLLQNGAEVSKESVIKNLGSCLRGNRSIEGQFLYSFMEEHGILYSEPNELLRHSKILGISNEKIKDMINRGDYKFGKETYSCCGSLENACMLLEKGVDPDYNQILWRTKYKFEEVTPLGASPEKLSKMSKEERIDLFERSKKILLEHQPLRMAALRNMIDIYYFSSEPEVRESFKETFMDLKRGKNYTLEINELKDAIKTSQGKDDKDIKSIGRVGLKTIYGRIMNKSR